ncbi:MAG: hypothetical protein LC663_05710, partial [Actinobacteria bacterium]|nr:hypothetical protein [Actinomycetota bacterium]
IFIVFGGLLLAREARRDEVRPYATSFALLLLFLIPAKVFSPQYALWLLPFFVLVEIPWYLFAAFAISEAAVWFTVSGYLITIQYHVGDGPFRLALTEIAVFVRAAVLLVLLAYSLFARENVGDVVPDDAPAIPEPAPA